MTVHLHEEDLPADARFAAGAAIAVDTETMGLITPRDRLCVVQLSDGGGDEHLYLWDWLEGRLLEKIPLLEPILEYLKGDSNHHANVTDFKAAITGIWRVPNSKVDIQSRCL